MVIRFAYAWRDEFNGLFDKLIVTKINNNLNATDVKYSGLADSRMHFSGELLALTSCAFGVSTLLLAIIIVLFRSINREKRTLKTFGRW